MRRLSAAVLVAGLLSPGALLAQGLDILKVIPEKALVVVVARDPMTMAAHLAQTVEKVTGGKPDEGFLLDEVLRSFKLHRTATAIEEDGTLKRHALVGTVDRKAPMAFVMTGGFGLGGKAPVGMVVRVKDYRGLLEELARIMAAPGPEVSAYGTDVIKGDEGALFAGRLGDFAVVTRDESVVRALKTKDERSLAETDPGDLRTTYAACDLAVYVNVDEFLKAHAFFIGMIRMMQQQQARAENEAMGEPLTPEQAAKQKARELDRILEWLGQVDALVVGTSFRAEGVRSTVLGVPRDQTRLQRIVKLMEPARLTLVETLGAREFLVAGAWHVPPELAKLVDEIEREYARKEGRIKEDELKAHAELQAKIRDVDTGESAFVWAAVSGGQPLIRMVFLSGMKRGAKLGDLRRRYLERELDLDDDLEQLGAESEMEENVDRHRDRPIDRLRVSFKPKAEAHPQMTRMLRALFGETMVIYESEVPGACVASIGYADSTALKTQIDRMLDEKPGGLVRMPAWKKAVEGLPEKHSGVLVFSVSSFLKVVPGFLSAMEPDAGFGFGQVNLERPSAFGLTFGPSPKGLRFHLNVPIAELKNIKKAIEDLTRPMHERLDKLRQEQEHWKVELEANLEEFEAERKDLEAQLKHIRELEEEVKEPAKAARETEDR